MATTVDEGNSEDPIARLSAAWDSFSVDLRVWRRFDEAAYERIKHALVELEARWADAEWLPKDLVITLVELAPAMESLSHLYGDEEAQRVQEAGFELQELVWRCVGISGESQS